MQVWWLNRMLTTPAPLQEKMALAFHGHFTTAAIQKGVSPAMVYRSESTLSRVRSRESARADPAPFRPIRRCSSIWITTPTSNSPERKLRARADGAVHAGSRSLLRRRRPQFGARLDGVAIQPLYGNRRLRPPLSRRRRPRRSSAKPAISPATTSSTSSSLNRSARAFSRRSSATRSSTTTRSRS